MDLVAATTQTVIVIAVHVDDVMLDDLWCVLVCVVKPGLTWLGKLGKLESGYLVDVEHDHTRLALGLGHRGGVVRAHSEGVSAVRVNLTDHPVNEKSNIKCKMKDAFTVG